MEAGVKYLAEKGVKQDSDVLKRAMTAFKELPNTDACYRGMWNIDVFPLLPTRSTTPR